jgi:hypothetical protein
VIPLARAIASNSSRVPAVPFSPTLEKYAPSGRIDDGRRGHRTGHIPRGAMSAGVRDLSNFHTREVRASSAPAGSQAGAGVRVTERLEGHVLCPLTV